MKLRRFSTLGIGLIGLVLGACVITPAQSSPADRNDPNVRQDDMVYELGNGVTPPKGTYIPDPEYSEKGRKKKISGDVALAMIVTAEGTVRDVKVIKTLEPSLDQQAVAAVKTWRFEPGTKDGKPVAVHLKADVTFRIR
jgi:TonB family protein